MKRIWKFELQVADRFGVEMPTGAKILSVGDQNGGPHLWAEVHPDNDRETRVFHCHGTGHDVPEDGRQYVGTAICHPFVWHYYERKAP